MFASSSLTSLSSDASVERGNEPATAASTAAHVTGYYDGPFASQSDFKAVKYLKDTSISSISLDIDFPHLTRRLVVGYEKWLQRYDPTRNESSHVLLKSLGVTVPPEIPEEQAVKLLRKTMHRM